MPTVGIACCCARTVNGKAAAAPPRSVMNSRRRISAPKLRGQHCIGSNEYFDRGSNSASKPLPQCTANVAYGLQGDIPINLRRQSLEECLCLRIVVGFRGCGSRG